MVPINQNNGRTFNFNYWYDYYFLSNIVYFTWHKQMVLQE